MSAVNPFDVIKKATMMSQSLKNEISENDDNTSLDSDQAKDRAPLMDAYIDNRLRSNKPITFLSFVDDLRSLWEAAGKEGKIIRHVPKKEDAKFPVITHRIVHRKINTSFKDLKPRYRGTIRHPYIEGEYIDLFGQIFDVDVEFCIHSSSAEQADELTIELEEFLQTYAGFFKEKGVQEILFLAQGEDEVLTGNRIPIEKRTLLYSIRFEKIIVRFLNEIQQIAVKANLHKEG